MEVVLLVMLAPLVWPPLSPNLTLLYNEVGVARRITYGAAAAAAAPYEASKKALG
jgi:hypothetical protein